MKVKLEETIRKHDEELHQKTKSNIQFNEELESKEKMFAETLQ